jgi:hypothetical protein
MNVLGYAEFRSAAEEVVINSLHHWAQVGSGINEQLRMSGYV